MNAGHQFTPYQAGVLRSILDDDGFLNDSWGVVETLKAAKADDEVLTLAPSRVQKELDSLKAAIERLSPQVRNHLDSRFEDNPKRRGLRVHEDPTIEHELRVVGPSPVDMMLARLDEPYQPPLRHPEKQGQPLAAWIFSERGIHKRCMTRYMDVILEAAGVKANARHVARKTAGWLSIFHR